MSIEGKFRRVEVLRDGNGGVVAENVYGDLEGMAKPRSAVEEAVEEATQVNLERISTLFLPSDFSLRVALR